MRKVPAVVLPQWQTHTVSRMTGRFAPDKRLTTSIVLGGAALLMGVAILLAANLILARPLADSTSPSPSPSVSASDSSEPSASASGSASPQVTPTPDATPSAQYLGPFAAIVLVDDLRVRSEPGLSGTPIAAFHADYVIQIMSAGVEADGDEWYKVLGRDNVVGWVSAGPPSDPYLDLRSRLPTNTPGYLWDVAAGPNGFLAWGSEPRRSDEPERPVLLASSDGRVWQRTSLPAEAAANIRGAAWGSSGWILVTATWSETEAGTLSDAGTFWQSADGLSWTQLPPFDHPGVVPSGLEASTTGYLMTVVDSRSGGWYDTYFSVDGQAWRPSGFPVSASSEHVSGWGVNAVPSGFVLWVTDATATRMFATSDGRGWLSTGASLPGSANDAPHVAVVGDRVVAVLTDYATGAQSLWRATLPGPTLSWTRQTLAEATLASTALTALVSNGSTLLLSGYDRSGVPARLWRSTDGATWSEVGGDARFGGVMPWAIAGGDAGFAGIGRVVTPAGANPVLWHSTDGLTWSGETNPVLGVVETSVIGSCPGLPATQVDWMAIPGSVAAECFGDTPITFTGWLTASDGCGGYSPGTWEPAWLVSIGATYEIMLTPFEAPYAGCGSAARHPSLLSLPDQQQWVRLTGHYDDPAAGTCHWSPDPLYPGAYNDPAALVVRCQGQFVGTTGTGAGGSLRKGRRDSPQQAIGVAGHPQVAGPGWTTARPV